MKKRKIGLIVGLLFIISFFAWFLYPRITLPRYIIDGITMTNKNNVYVLRRDCGKEDIHWKGKIIGIAIRKDSKHKLQEFLLPEWVREYMDNNEHDSISICTLMGPVEIFDKDSK